MKPPKLIALLVVLAGMVMAGPGCEARVGARDKGQRTILQTLPDPSGRWIAVVDRVEYANGLLTSVADRVLVVESDSTSAEGTIVFSENALPDKDRPTVAWSGGRLLISISPGATELHQELRAHGIEMVVSRRGPSSEGSDSLYLRAAAELRSAIEQGRVEGVIAALSPNGLKVGDSALSAADAARDLRQQGRLHAKFFDTAKRRRSLAESPLGSQILSFRDWFLRHRDAEVVVERQGPEVMVWYRPKGSQAPIDDLMPSFTFCNFQGQPKLCRPPDDT